MIFIESIQSLITKNKEDTETLSLIEDCLLSFHEYHTHIYKMEIWLKLYNYHNIAKDDYQTQRTDLDRARSLSHNAVISNIGILNRLCQQNDIPFIYKGVVSEERPHRVELANAVLAYVEDVVSNRIK